MLMTRSHSPGLRVSKLVALAAVLVVSLSALPSTASADTPECHALVTSTNAAVANPQDVLEGESLGLTLVCTGGAAAVDGYQITSPATNGVATASGALGAGVSYSPLASAPASDSFAFTATDSASTAYPIVTVNLAIVPHPVPVCVANGGAPISVVHGGSVTIPFSCSGDATGANPYPVSVVDPSVTLGSTTAPDNTAHTVKYTAADTVGSDTLWLQASSPNSQPSAPFSVAITVKDSAPTCTVVTTTMRSGPGAQTGPFDLASACHDSDGDPMTFEAPDDQSADHGLLDTGDPTAGTATYFEDSGTYAQPTPFTDSFSVGVSDGAIDGNGDAIVTSLTVHVVVSPDHAPVCSVLPANDFRHVAHSHVTITIPFSCSDADGDSFSVALGPRPDITPGDAVLNDAGTAIVYTTRGPIAGTDAIDVQVSSDRDPSETSDLVIHTVVTDATPVCSSVTLAVPAGGSVAGRLSCTDADGDSLVYSIITPLNGTIFKAGSTFTYVPNPGYAGVEQFEATVYDGVVETPIPISVVVSPSLQTAAPVAGPSITPVTQAAATKPTPPAPTLAGKLVVASGKIITLPVKCVSRSASCKATVGFATKVRGKRVALGSRAVTMKHSTRTTVRVVLSRTARKALHAMAGKKITIDVTITTKNPHSGVRTSTVTALKLKT
ncbi:MAG TPA: Ig-like domain-containing protein [Gaiellales bacterium]|jgi:hypothetical protein